MTFLNACRNGQKGIVQIFLKKSLTLMCDFFTPVYLHRPGTPSALSSRPKTGTKPLAPPPEFAGPERMSKRHVQGRSVCLSDWVNHDTQRVDIRAHEP